MMAYSDLRKGRISQPGVAYHITTVTLNRTAYFSSLYMGRKVVRQLMRLQVAG